MFIFLTANNNVKFFIMAILKMVKINGGYLFLNGWHYWCTHHWYRHEKVAVGNSKT